MHLMHFNKKRMTDYDEDVYVYQVYDTIAEHFSQTRWNVWPSVAKFLDDIPDDSRVLEAGCGNGKNLVYLKNVKQKEGCDTSHKFVEMVQKKGIKCQKANVTDLPYPNNTFDLSYDILQEITYVVGNSCSSAADK